MKKRLRDVLDDVEYADLLKLSDDLKNGGTHLRRLVQTKIKETEEKDTKICATCGNIMLPGHDNDFFELQFGPPGFRRKATFDALDCLEFFIENKIRKEPKSI